MSDLQRLFTAQDHELRWMAERENATARLEIARVRKHAATLISQHEPLVSIGVDREKLRAIFEYLFHGSVERLKREIPNE